MFKIVNDKKYSSIIARRNYLEEKTRELKNEVKKIEGFNLALKIDKENLEEEVLKLQLRIEDLNEQLAHLNKKVTEAQKETASCKGGYTKKINSLKEQLKEMSEEIFKKAVINQELHEQVEKLKKENAFLKKPTVGQLKTEKMYKTERKLK